MKKITRRDFLKVAGVVGATAAMAGCAGMAPGAETAASSAASAATSTAAAGSVAAATGNMELTEPVQLTFAAQEVGTAAYNYAAALQSVMLPQLPAGSTIDITTTSPGGVGAPMIVNGGEECDLVMSNAGPAKWSYEQSTSEYEFGGCTEIACLAGDLGQNFINVMFTQKFVDTTGYKTFEEVVANKYPVKMVIKKNGSFGEQTAEKVCEALGITFDDIESWGGKVEKTGGDAIKSGLQDDLYDMTIDHIDRVLGETLGVSHVQLDHLKLIGNPNLGIHTTREDVLDGIRTLTELVAPYKPLDFFCVWEPLYEQVKGAVSAPLLPIRLYLTYPWNRMPEDGSY